MITVGRYQVMPRFLRPLLLAAALLLVTPGTPAQQARLTDADAVTSATSATSTGSAYTFSATYNGRPVRWNPCTAIHWRFNPAGAPTSGLTVVKQSLASIALATGTAWVYDGTTTSVPTKSWLPTNATQRPVLIGWTTPTASNLLSNQAKAVLAVTQNSWVPVQGQGKVLASVVALDRTDSLPITGPRSWRTVVLHELGHAMGLGHAGSSGALMNSQLSSTLASLASGDLLGLTKVGRAAGCLG